MKTLNQGEILLLSQLGHSLYREGQYEKAISVFEGLAALQPQQSQFHAVLSLLYHLTDRRDAALNRDCKHCV
jgi:Flp pilus assembly protein TadD